MEESEEVRRWNEMMAFTEGDSELIEMRLERIESQLNSLQNIFMSLTIEIRHLGVLLDKVMKSIVS